MASKIYKLYVYDTADEFFFDKRPNSNQIKDLLLKNEIDPDCTTFVYSVELNTIEKSKKKNT